MKAINLIIILLSISFFACKKKEIETNNSCEAPPNPYEEATSTEYFPLTVGSYWIYEKVKIDSNGIETNFGTDTTRIIGDTVINGKVYSTFTGTEYYAINGETYFRDSAGYIISAQGGIIFDFFDFTTITSEVDYLLQEWIRTHQLIDLTNTPLSVPAGVFTTVDSRTTFSRVDGTPIDYCGNLAFDQHANYAKNVGLVFSNFAYYNEIPQCIQRHRRLIEYNIAP